MAPGQPDGVLLVDKPPGFSSTQTLGRSKRLLAARKAGHTGTLDPFATGLLPLVFGEATKFARFLSDAAKSYVATLDLGVRSSTGDTEGTLTARNAIDVDARMIDEVLAGFKGVLMQVPPMHSAVHHHGRRLYDLAREGVEVDRVAREVEILALHRLSLDGSALQIAVTCSKGTYVRTLAAEIGDAMGCGAYLTALRRTGVGPFEVGQAASLAELEALGVDGARARLLPVHVLVESLPRWDAAGEAALRFTQGQAVECPCEQAGEEWSVFDPAGRFVGVGRCEAAGRLLPERLLATQGPAKLPDFA